jgi:hypothetical protein
LPSLNNFFKTWACLWLFQALIGLPITPLAPSLQASMLGHMGQLFLLTAWPALWCRRRCGRSWLHHRLHVYAHDYRWSGLVLVLGVWMLWMVPRWLDLAQTHMLVNGFKVFSLGCSGLCLALIWPHLSLPVRGLLHLEALATLWRMGWLYAESPIRLCTQYGQIDQQRLGHTLGLLGVAYGLFLLAGLIGWKPTPYQSPRIPFKSNT